MIKKMLAAAIVLFGLGVTNVPAQEVIKGPNDYEKLVLAHPTICSSFKDMTEFLNSDDADFKPLFRGKNDIATLGNKVDIKEPSTIEIQYSSKMKSAVVILFDKKNDTACFLSGISNPELIQGNVNEVFGRNN